MAAIDFDNFRMEDTPLVWEEAFAQQDPLVQTDTGTDFGFEPQGSELAADFSFGGATEQPTIGSDEWFMDQIYGTDTNTGPDMNVWESMLEQSGYYNQPAPNAMGTETFQQPNYGSLGYNLLQPSSALQTPQSTMVGQQNVYGAPDVLGLGGLGYPTIPSRGWQPPATRQPGTTNYPTTPSYQTAATQQNNYFDYTQPNQQTIPAPSTATTPTLTYPIPLNPVPGPRGWGEQTSAGWPGATPQDGLTNWTLPTATRTGAGGFPSQWMSDPLLRLIGRDPLAALTAARGFFESQRGRPAAGVSRFSPTTRRPFFGYGPLSRRAIKRPRTGSLLGDFQQSYSSAESRRTRALGSRREAVPGAY